MSGEIPWLDVLGGLNAAEQSCIRERFDEAGFGVWAEADRISEPALAQAWDLVFSLLACLPEPSDFGSAQPGGSWMPEAAEVVNIGEPLEDALDEDDTDLFVFEAVEGEVYEIVVAPGTLVDPTVTLYDADGLQLVYADDSEDSQAPLLFWSADGSGPLYVQVGGYDAGSYTLTVAVDDDHAGRLAGATAVEVGEAVEGVLDYDGDVDFFVFEAVEGETYEMGVGPGTVMRAMDGGCLAVGAIYEMSVAPGILADPATVTLYDADGVWLDSDSPCLYWRAATTGPLYVEVRGYGSTGSYTLKIAR